MVQAAVDEQRAEQLRRELVAQLVRDGSIVSDEVRRAFEAVPRHLFAPEVSLEAAYANDIVRTKVNRLGDAAQRCCGRDVIEVARYVEHRAQDGRAGRAGPMALTLMPYWPRSTAATRAKWASAALLAE